MPAQEIQTKNDKAPPGLERTFPGIPEREQHCVFTRRITVCAGLKRRVLIQDIQLPDRTEAPGVVALILLIHKNSMASHILSDTNYIAKKNRTRHLFVEV
jgi:hypothetical protein